MEINKEDLKAKLSETGKTAGSAASSGAKKAGTAVKERAKILTRNEIFGLVGIAAVSAVCGLYLITPTNADKHISDPYAYTEPAPVEEDMPMGDDYEDVEEPVDELPEEDFYGEEYEEDSIDPFGEVPNTEDINAHLYITFDGNVAQENAQMDISFLRDDTGEVVYSYQGSVAEFDPNVVIEGMEGFEPGTFMYIQGTIADQELDFTLSDGAGSLDQDIDTVMFYALDIEVSEDWGVQVFLR